MPSRVFVAAVRRPWEAPKPKRRVVLKSVGRNRIQNGRRRADVGHDEVAAHLPTGQQEVAGLLAKERDGQNRPDGAQSFTRIAHDAARDVNGDNRRSLPGRGSQSFRDLTIQRAAEPRAEDRVHHEFRPFERGGRQWLGRATPSLRMMARFALQTVARSEQRQANGPTGFDKAPGGHETVAAIVAGSAQDGDGTL